MYFPISQLEKKVLANLRSWVWGIKSPVAVYPPSDTFLPLDNTSITRGGGENINTESHSCRKKYFFTWEIWQLCNRVVLITPSSWIKLLPVVFVFLLVYYLRKHLSFLKSEWFRGICNFFFTSMGISMGKWPKIIFLAIRSARNALQPSS